MKPLRFSYREYPILDKEGKITSLAYRPVIDVRLIFKEKSRLFPAIIDSGADESLFPGWMAKFLGHHLEKGKKVRLFRGIGGEIKAYLHQTYIEIGGIGFRCDTYYSDKFNDWEYGLLGEKTFFSHFKIELDYKNKLIVLTPK
ncbi:MAG: hypothetical protein KAX20_03355 [Candidatus Omnitrophica bacterium]|nr:hypothetical protein [Candidatus Omnitrophota bacterium]